MSVRTVCISRTVAAGAESVGRWVSDRLGFRYVDEEIISTAAEKANVDANRIAEAEHRQSLLGRLFDSMRLGAGNVVVTEYFGAAPGAFDFYAPGVPIVASMREEYRTLIREVIHEVANQGNAVIVAHAASMALADALGVLRVLVTASLATRAQRMRLEGHLLNEDEATKAVKESDRERQDYLYRFYEVSEELPTHYDLVVNTDRLRPEQAAEVIVRAAQS
ncbi:MAG TPA: cytidylate kinase-like family protein [Candidatus Margulisiibacteriota bacterium]|nr:cytidylate kinase-like family protein [Candidatus Margulisiibacteriota bacterium]